MSFHISVLQAASFLDLFAVSLIIPLLPRHVRELGAGYIYVGLLRSIYSGFQLAFGPLIGSLSDLKGRRWILLMTLVVSSIVYIIMGITDSLIIIMLLRAFLGSFKQTQMLIKAMVPDYEADAQKQVEIYGKIVATCGLGTSMSPIMAGYFVEGHPNNGYTILSVVVSLLFILNSMMVYILLPEIRKTRKKRSCNECNHSLFYTVTSSLKQSINQLYRIKWSIFWDIFLLRFLIGFAMSIYFSSYSIYVSSQFGLTPKYIGYIVSFQAMVSSLSSYFAGYVNRFYTNDPDYTQRNLHVFFMMTAAFLGLTLSYNIFIFILFLAPISISSTWGCLLNIEMVLKRGHGKYRGSLMGASNSVKSISNVIAPMVGGIIGHFIGITYVSYAALLAAALGFIISFKINMKTRAS